uniref:Uncharacterized protein n=1 Tax=Avena sativa TaxID=4498 RepID=A0ACD5Y3X8_AVESA
MGRKTAIDPKNLPPWFSVEILSRGNGATYKKYKDLYNNKTYRSMDQVARAFGLDGNNIPCPRPLNMRKEDGSSVPIPMLDYTTIPAIPEYVPKDFGSDSSNLEKGEERSNTTRDVPGIMKEEKQNENGETGHAASHFEKEEEIAKKIDAPSADAASMKEI